MSDLVKRLERNISSRRLLKKGQRVLIAVSGGLDSMVLLQLLQHLSKPKRWRLSVAHFNHQLRGRSSDADERLVRSAADELDVQLIVEGANVREFSRRHGLSLEMAARKLRHDFLARTAQAIRAHIIALAHHADDQVELFFLRLFRGSGAEALAGMRWKSPSPSDPTLDLIRPLLDLPKAALRAHAAEYGIRFREDASNASLDFQRNRIRHELLPLLRSKYQGALDRTVPRVMEIIGAEADLVGQMAREWLLQMRRALPRARKPIRPLALHSAERFEDLPLAVQRRCVQLQLMDLDLEADYDLIEQLRAAAGRPVSARHLRPITASLGVSPAARLHAPSKPGEGTDGGTPQVCVVRDDTGRLHLREGGPVGFDQDYQKVDISHGAGEVCFKDARIGWRITAKKGISDLKTSPGQESFDADQIGSPILLRHWRPGDRFQPIGMSQPIKLQDLFTNEKVPRSQRRLLLLATTSRGEIFWVEGLRISERFKLTKSTIRRLQWLRHGH